jgi:hypothetical protein
MPTAAFILSIIKAIPAIESIFKSLITLYYQQIDAAYDAHVSANQKKREAIIAALQKEGLTDENRDSLRRLLYDISRG